jgi:hypothetical protein
MIESVDEYLDLLKGELAGSDPATIQDALSDAEEHLRTVLSTQLQAGSGISEAEAMPRIVEEYGAPGEIAAAYRDIEVHTRPALAGSRHRNGRSAIVRFLSVFADPKAWGAVLYMLFSILTGILYFTWAATGLSLSLGLMILIIGVPVATLFLVSVRGIALVEGRLVEALLGVRMPRRAAFLSRGNLKLSDRLKILVTEKRTWLSILYMLLQLPLGILYFTLVVVLMALSVSLMAMPVLVPVFDIAVLSIGGQSYRPPDWLTPFYALGGLALMTLTMHLARWIGRAHGALAKSMLVGG